MVYLYLYQTCRLALPRTCKLKKHIFCRNPGKSGQIAFWGSGGLGGMRDIFTVNIMKGIARKLRRIVLLHFGLITFRSHYWKTLNPSCSWFRDFRTWPWAAKPILLIFWRHHDIITHPRKNTNRFWEILFVEISNCWKSKMILFGRDGRRELSTIRLINSWRSWIWEQYLPEDMKWKIGDLGWISSDHIKWFSKLWKFETLELWNQETLKPRNQETKRPRNQETKNPPTHQHTDSHPCTRPPSWATWGNLGDTSGFPLINRKWHWN